MDSDVITLIWLAVGLLLIAFELFMPGLVVVFAGLGALAVALLRFVGVIEGLPASFATWLASSILMVLVFRSTVKKWFPADVSKKPFDEDVEAFGKVVDVLEEVTESGEAAPVGRIRFQGTTWPAVATEGTIPKGAKARLVFRNNIAWVIERVPELEEKQEG